MPLLQDRTTAITAITAINIDKQHSQGKIRHDTDTMVLVLTALRLTALHISY